MQAKPWIIVQAGGLGSRMKHLTTHRPKCLVPVGGQTIISNVINIFGSDRLIVIGDYLIDVLKNYVDIFYPDVKIVKASTKGTCGGLREAISLINDENPVIFMWSDLFFEKFPEIDFSKKTIGLSRTFPCRYQYNNAEYTKMKGNTAGVAGFFCFPNSKYLLDAPDEGSFVGEYLKNAAFNFDKELWLDDVKEIGTLEALREYESKSVKSRFFNDVIVTTDSVTKKAKDERFLHLLENEKRWYKKIESIENFDEVPRVLNDTPFQIEHRKGIHPYNLVIEERKKTLVSIASFLNRLHQYEVTTPNILDLNEMYLQKTSNRTLRYTSLISSFNKKFLEINGEVCLNPFFAPSQLEEAYSRIKCEQFSLIHGDLTFSNCLWDSSCEKLSVFDPRGVFGSSKIIGDPAYDWAKVYYSSVDLYDMTNTKNFEIVKISDDTWLVPELDKDMHELFWSLCAFDRTQVMLRLSFIWFSLIGYVENDVDAMNLAFLKGCLALQLSRGTE